MHWITLSNQEYVWHVTYIDFGRAQVRSPESSKWRRGKAIITHIPMAKLGMGLTRSSIGIRFWYQHISDIASDWKLPKIYDPDHESRIMLFWNYSCIFVFMIVLLLIWFPLLLTSWSTLFRVHFFILMTILKQTARVSDLNSIGVLVDIQIH